MEKSNAKLKHFKAKTLLGSVLELMRQLLITSCAFLIAVLFGHWVIMPAAHLLSDGLLVYLRDGIVGAIAIFLGFLMVRRIVIAFYNQEELISVVEDVPVTFRDYADFGVETPFDFCVFMSWLFSREMISPYAISTATYAESHESSAWEKAIGMFELMFSRKPERYEDFGNLSWTVYSYYEIKKTLQLGENDEIPIHELLNAISPKLKDCLEISISDGKLCFGVV